MEEPRYMLFNNNTLARKLFMVYKLLFDTITYRNFASTRSNTYNRPQAGQSYESKRNHHFCP